MNIASKILNRVHVVVAVYGGPEEYELSLWESVRRGGESELTVKDVPESKDGFGKVPVLLLIGGHGVIAKAAAENPDMIEQVVSDPGKFICNYFQGKERFCFVRREQTEKPVSYLEGLGAKIISTGCFDARQDDVEAMIGECVGELYSETVTLRNAFRPSPGGSLLAQLLFHRIKMPVLAAVLALLVANFLVGKNVGEKYSTQRQEMLVLERSIGRQNDSSRIRRQIVAEFSRTLPYRYALLCDRIGSVVPPNVTLTQLGIQPRRKALEQGKRPELAEREIVVRGEAGQSGDVSAFVSDIRGLGLSDDIRLTSVDRDRETGIAVFQINITL